MRLENLPDGGHVKVIWSRERSRDCTRDKVSRQRDSKTWWRRTTTTLLGVSFGSYRKRRRDVLMERGGNHWEVLVTYHWGVIGCFIWDLFEASWRCTDGTLPLRPYKTPSRHNNKASWRRTTETSWLRTTETLLGVSFETCPRCRGDVLMEGRHYVPMRRHHHIPIRRHEDVPLRCLGNVPLRRCWVFHLRRTCDVTGTYRETSLRRRHVILLPGGKF